MSRFLWVEICVNLKAPAIIKLMFRKHKIFKIPLSMKNSQNLNNFLRLEAKPIFSTRDLNYSRRKRPSKSKVRLKLFTKVKSEL